MTPTATCANKSLHIILNTFGLGHNAWEAGTPGYTSIHLRFTDAETNEMKSILKSGKLKG